MKSSNENGKSKKGSKVKASGRAKNTTENISGITQEEIREKANELYMQRIERGEYGTAENDWTEAERFLSDAER
jgi:hypothetical protein